MILLDRLIYYYQIYLLFNENKLEGFANSVGLAIYTHGSYEEYNVNDPIYIERVKAPVENMFICTKSAPGCITHDYGELIMDDFLNQDSSLWVMSNNIEQKRYVNFDETVFRLGECERKKRRNDLNYAFCYREDTKRGRSMEHYISPNSKRYIDKLYQGNRDDYKCYVINLETFYNIRDSPITLYEKIQRCSIIEDPYFKSKLTYSSDNKTFTFFLSDIMDYCSRVLQKTNVFIYDRSCGGTPGTRRVNGILIYTPIEDVIRATNEFARQGFGIKKMKHHKRKSKKNRKSNRKTRRPTTRY
jgi:hypothetical protein